MANVSNSKIAMKKLFFLSVLITEVAVEAPHAQSTWCISPPQMVLLASLPGLHHGSLGSCPQPYPPLPLCWSFSTISLIFCYLSAFYS
jgi:hypothetical protein